MSEHAGSEGGGVAMVGPERRVDFMNAVVVDEGANLVEPGMELWRRCQIQHGNDLLHMSVRQPCRLPLTDRIDREPAHAQDDGGTGQSAKGQSDSPVSN